MIAPTATDKLLRDANVKIQQRRERILPGLALVQKHEHGFTELGGEPGLATPRYFEITRHEARLSQTKLAAGRPAGITFQRAGVGMVMR